MVDYDFCPHCGNYNPDNYVIENFINQNGDEVEIETIYGCESCGKLYRYIEIYYLQDCDSIPIYDELP